MHIRQVVYDNISRRLDTPGYRIAAVMAGILYCYESITRYEESQVGGGILRHVAG